jgi:putative membrane protein
MWPHMASMGWWMVLGWGLGLTVLVLLAWLLVRAAGGLSSRHDDAPEEILKRRYARGEIDREDYQRRLDDLRR